MASIPKVSIIMPVYNGEKHIKESINSVINQTMKEWELIVINDGSTDNTEDIIKKIHDNRIVLISQNNAGVSTARNKGLEKARAKYITFLDADDTLPKNSLKCRYDFLEKNPDIDLVDGIIKIKNQELKKTLRTYRPYYVGKLLPELLKLNDKVFLGICYFFKACLIEEHRFKECMTHGEDLLFYIQLSCSNDINYAYVNKEIYNYRRNNLSAMTNLHGLENGYIQLLKEIKNLDCISSAQFSYIKIKIIKIMFLSWLNKKKYFNALKSIVNILFLKEHR